MTIDAMFEGALLAPEFSRYAQRAFAARPETERFVRRHRAGALGRAGLESRLEALLAAAQRGGEALDPLCDALRRLREEVFCSVMERDLAGLADVAEVTATMTALAELAIARLLSEVENGLRRTFGAPLGESTKLPLALGVIAMGKLGGGELNVSSDIDLIFVYEEDGETAGGERSPISNQEYFNRVARKLIGALAERTAAGYVFRVDMRLRPNGESGALVSSLSTLERYFYTQGREWERYAWIKARLMGTLEPAQAAIARLDTQLQAISRPFVYRRYLDYGVIAAIRALHAQIRQEALRRAAERPERGDDVKLGRGGIREIEFSAQVFQLIYGGQDPMLRVMPTLEVIARAQARGLMSAASATQLCEAYGFLRQVEHRLQYADDAQTHAIPVDEAARATLASSLGFADYAAFATVLDAHRAHVEAEFDAIFSDRNQEEGAGAGALALLWDDCLSHAEGAEASAQRLQALGFDDALALGARLRAARSGARYQQLPALARSRFDALVLRTLDMSRELEPERRARAASRMLDLLERVGGRSAYLSLLTEYPNALRRVLGVLASSRWAADFLIRHPQLLDELLDAEAIDSPFDWPAFSSALRTRLAALETVEQQMDALRHAHHAEVFRILLRDLGGQLSVEQVSDRLSELADAILGVTLDAVWRHIAGSGGQQEAVSEAPRFAIVAYGKLGGKELGYESDLDLIFLYDDLERSELYVRLARRLITWLTTATGAGVIYDIDLRLRPNGESGLLVTALDAFRRYQLRAPGQANTAWLWEHQAITRARFCAGDEALGAAFTEIRLQVMSTPREAHALLREIVSMRERVAEGHPNKSGLFDLKHDRGGMVDVEFMVQYLILLHAPAHPALRRNTGNIGLLAALADLGQITREAALKVGSAYRTYRALQHRLRLDGQAQARVAPESVVAERAAVLSLWDELLRVQ